MTAYTNPALVTDTATDAEAPRNPYSSGYGRQIPTAHKIRYDGRWRRVYVMQYGNGGSAYIKVRGEDLFLDSGTEHRLEGGRATDPRQPKIRMGGLADVISTIPVTLGHVPDASIVAVTFAGKWMEATIRVDLPAAMTGDFTTKVLDYLRMAKAERCVLVAFDKSAAGAEPAHEEDMRFLAEKVQEGGVEVFELALVAGEYWVDYVEGIRRPAVELAFTEFAAYAMANGIVKQLQDIPELHPDADHRARITAQAREVVGEQCGLEVCELEAIYYPLWNGVLAGGTAITGGIAARLLPGFEHKWIRDGLLTRILRENAGIGEYQNLLLGKEVGDFDRARFDRGLEALAHLATLADSPEARAALLTGLGWMNWLRGEGTVAGRFYDAAKEIVPGYRLAELLHEVLSRGLLSDLAARRECWV